MLPHRLTDRLVNRHSFDKVGLAYGAPPSQKPATRTEGESAATQYFKECVDELLTGGVRQSHQTSVAAGL